MVTSLNSALKTVLDNLAPERKVLKSLRPKCRWYNSGLRSHKRKVWKLEKSGLSISWIHYGLHIKVLGILTMLSWTFPRDNHLRIKSQNAVETARSSIILLPILRLKSVGNPLPTSNNNEGLANSFTSFFEDKILAIRKQFLNIPQYQSEALDVPKLTRFQYISLKNK